MHNFLIFTVYLVNRVPTIHCSLPGLIPRGYGFGIGRNRHGLGLYDSLDRDVPTLRPGRSLPTDRHTAEGLGRSRSIPTPPTVSFGPPSTSLPEVTETPGGVRHHPTVVVVVVLITNVSLMTYGPEPGSERSDVGVSLRYSVAIVIRVERLHLCLQECTRHSLPLPTHGP